MFSHNTQSHKHRVSAHTHLRSTGSHVAIVIEGVMIPEFFFLQPQDLGALQSVYQSILESNMRTSV